MTSIARNEAGGILLLDKPAGITSQDAVNIVRKVFGTKQAGHTGTLDPMATGLLIVLVGRAVKASEYAVCDRKSYEAVLRLGKTYDTEDITGTVLTESISLPPEDAVRRVCSSFIGETDQIPPMYSAIKVGGKKLYELAREGKEIERTPRKITIYSLGVSKLSDTDYSLSVECSSGTYIRTLCADIGAALGCGGAMAALRRTSVGNFRLSDAISVEELKNIGNKNSFPDNKPKNIDISAAAFVKEQKMDCISENQTLHPDLDLKANMGCISDDKTLHPDLEQKIGCISDDKTLHPDLDISSLLLPVERLFDIYPFVKTSAFHEKLLRSGCDVAAFKLGIKDAVTGQKYRITNAGGIFYALGELTDGPEGPALKSLKLFSLN